MTSGADNAELQSAPQIFLKNCWYLCAWAEEVSAEKILARQIAGEHLAITRDADGMAFALADSCPHRFLPLSMGQCQAGVITCPYHGLRFAADGRCVENPHGPISTALSVASYPLVERHDALWIWLGEQPADESRLPDFSFIERTPSAQRAKGYLHTKADYRLMVDNIMDLTHADYMHASTRGGDINTRAKVRVEQTGETVSITWTAYDDHFAPIHVQAVPGCTGRGDFFNRVDWFTPGNMLLRIVLSLPGKLDSKEAVDSHTCHVVTPESDGLTHYFFCHTSDTIAANAEIAPKIKETPTRAFASEDKPLLEAQSQRIGGRNFGSLGPAMLPTDKGAVLVRRQLEKMIRAARAERKALTG